MTGVDVVDQKPLLDGGDTILRVILKTDPWAVINVGAFVILTFLLFVVQEDWVLNLYLLFLALNVVMCRYYFIVCLIYKFR